MLSGVKKIKESLGPAPASSSRAESLFIWVCKQPQFPPTPDCLISCPSDTRPVSQPISSRPFLQQSLTHPAPSPPHQLGVTSSKGIPEEISFAPITGQSGRLREMKVKPRGLISLCDDQGTLIFFFFPFGTSEVGGKIARAKDK